MARTTGKDQPQPAAPDPTPAEEVQPDPSPAPPPPPDQPPAEPAQDTAEEPRRPRTMADLLADPFGLRAAQAAATAANDVPFPLSVGEAIAEVPRRIGAIEKTGRSTEGYRFRGIDQALAALHPILGDVGLVIVPGSVIREQWETRATAKGGTLNVARLLVSYTFMGPDGSTLPAAAW